ncbi:hypothetical protein KUTeg_003098 [Tegillarca granosa]|uniref:NADH dehydrogenase [ubiquinone] 1 beta subcomplex subunit 10 n=1 Tax=Tegillarca granosa TaxID=220873 RepID=A0ABQ9FL58_TEGGR|nr:hypothetical protein KUTeg_003098 [Tegillarca granosa]
MKMPSDGGERKPLDIFTGITKMLLVTPVEFIRENVVEAFRGKDGERPVYYHRRFRRVPTIDQCYEGELVCQFEANEQFKRDKQVDKQILRIMNERKTDCFNYHLDDRNVMCAKVSKEYEEAADNFFIKYGDLPVSCDVLDVYMKQKHRLIWERRQREKGLLKDE